MKKLISNQICPEVNLRDTLYLWRQVLGIKSQSQLNFSDFFQTDQYTLTNTARSALTLLIDQLNLPKNKKIGIPAFCCCVMATPFLSAGYQIEWIDTDDNGLLSIKDFEAKSKNLSLVLVPHIFGQRAPIEAISTIAESKNILVIEDCAHRLPDRQLSNLATQQQNHKSIEEGNPFQPVRLFSFGREKVISCISGGALVFSSSQVLKFSSFLLPVPKLSWTLRHMLQPLIYNLSINWYFQGGKILPYLARKLNILPLAVTPSEKQGHEDIPLAGLGLPHQKLLRRQILSMNNKIDHKKTLSKAWKEVLIKKLNIPKKDITIPDNYFRVILHLPPKSKQKLIKQAQKAGFYLREWDGLPISPFGVDLKAFGYTSGQCPHAEKFAQNYLTLPTHQRITLKDIQRFGDQISRDKSIA